MQALLQKATFKWYQSLLLYYRQVRTVPNPKRNLNLSAISLRSGKQLEETKQAAFDKQLEGPKQATSETKPALEKEEIVQGKQGRDEPEFSIHFPFPQRAIKFKKLAETTQEKEILETFRKVAINIPLLETINQIPKYAKFLKELCTNKRRLKGDELVSVSRNISAVIQPMPEKCNDPGMFTIPCLIGNYKFDDCMLDLGASINVMPKFVYDSLGLGPLHVTAVVIQLANRSSSHLTGLIKDVLVMVNELIFSPNSRLPIILGRPFIKTATTKIDVYTHTLSLEFDDSIVHFSIFDAMKHSRVKVEHSVSCINVIHDVNNNVDTDLIVDSTLLVDSDLPTDNNSDYMCDLILSARSPKKEIDYANMKLYS
ncbi:uncharacterized protein LOC133286093 [Gastrolobium bilobum]|uniref:uncharacterized protein LOC133286093 n=1 Tax=Gastrolobium bilobum TaxID=150636 RepID=UPI002AB0A15B|nr:uncharacterized protein LOC133286093 [Gastrolobium bilobum]